MCSGPYLLLLLFFLDIFCASAYCISLRFNHTSSLFLSFKCSRHEVASVLVCTASSAAQCPAVKLAHPQHTGTAGTQHAHSGKHRTFTEAGSISASHPLPTPLKHNMLTQQAACGHSEALEVPTGCSLSVAFALLVPFARGA